MQKKNGDFQGALIYFDKMLSLSKLWHSFYGYKKYIEGGEIDRAEKSLEQFLAKYQNLYVFTFQKDGAIPNDTLLSATDYKYLLVLNDTANQSLDVKRPVSKSKASITNASDQSRHSDEYGIPIRWIEGNKLGAVSQKASYLGKSGKSLSIETFALEYYQGLSFLGYWAENEYWWAIMALLFWDVIFAKLPGAFSPESFQLNQDIPTDFFSKNFYPKRERLIEKRISELTQPRFLGLKQPNIELELTSAFKSHYWKPCRPMNWRKYSKVDELLLATKSLSGTQLMKIMNRLLINHNENRRGLPDLFMSQNGMAFFVEVKSEKEKVADYQYEWLKYLQKEVMVSVEICRVINISS